MISIITFIIMIIGSLNWLSIGVLQYDFIAGLFGSQANVFSRIAYAIIGISAFFVCFALIKGKGKLKIDKKIFKNKKNESQFEINNPQPQQPSQSQHSSPYSPQQGYINNQAIIPPNQGYYNPPNMLPNQTQNQTQAGFSVGDDSNKN